MKNEHLIIIVKQNLFVVLTQYRLISELCGAPDDELLNKIERLASRATRTTMEQFGSHRKDFAQKFVGADSLAVDFLERVLVLDPERRSALC